MTKSYNVKVKDLCPSDTFIVYPKQLMIATHWRDGEGSYIKLSDTLKTYYLYRLHQYNYFRDEGKRYFESRESVSKLLGISVNVICRKLDPLLKDMGLLRIEKGRQFNEYEYIVSSWRKVSDNLVNLNVEQPEEVEEEESQYTFEQIKINNKNRAKVPLLKSNYEQEMIVIPKGEFLVQRKGQ